MALVIGDWLATPAPLNTEKHGDRARFSGDNSVVERWEPGQYAYGCVFYTSRPLPPGQVWQTTILNSTTRRRGAGLVSGCVLCLLYHLVMSMYIFINEHCAVLLKHFECMHTKMTEIKC